LPDVEGQGISAVSIRSGQLSVRRIRKLGSAVTIKGKSLIKADLDSCERIGIGKRRSRHQPTISKDDFTEIESSSAGREHDGMSILSGAPSDSQPQLEARES